MWQLLKYWYQRYFSAPDAMILLLILIVGVLVITTMGNIFAPVLASIVIAYLMDWLVSQLDRLKVPHVLAVSLVFIVMFSLVLLAILLLMPLLWRQFSNFLSELPSMLTHGQALLSELPQRYPDIISASQIHGFIAVFRTDVSKYGQMLLSWSISSITSIMVMVVYLVLVPLLVFFLLKDREKILAWLTRCLPQQHGLVLEVWDEVYLQIGNYVRGKVFEVVIISVVTYIAFELLDLRYAILLGVAVGLSVIIPYIGAVLVTIPVVVMGLIQWGWSMPFAYLIIVYAVIIALDANVLVPLLFSEVVDIHPIAIIFAVLFFGGIWGFWGVFFAIPLASLVKAVGKVWFVGVERDTNALES